MDRVRADFDFVLVHGDPDFIPLDESFPAASEIANVDLYWIYQWGRSTRRTTKLPAPTRCVSVGGGAVGGTCCRQREAGVAAVSTV